jgi:cytochrome P450
MLELKLVLATLVSQAELELVDSHPESLRRREVTLTPARGVKMRLIDC